MHEKKRRGTGMRDLKSYTGPPLTCLAGQSHRGYSVHTRGVVHIHSCAFWDQGSVASVTKQRSQLSGSYPNRCGCGVDFGAGLKDRRDNTRAIAGFVLRDRSLSPSPCRVKSSHCKWGSAVTKVSRAGCVRIFENPNSNSPQSNGERATVGATT